MDKDEICWEVAPLRGNPLRAFFFWLLSVIVMLASFFYTGEIIISAVLTALWFGVLLNAVVPARFGVGSQGAWADYRVFRRDFPWSRVRRVSWEKSGLFLSPFPRPTPLENFRGLFLPWGSSNKEEIRAFVEKILGFREGERNGQ
jgi:hypothetical protein